MKRSQLYVASVLAAVAAALEEHIAILFGLFVLLICTQAICEAIRERKL